MKRLHVHVGVKNLDKSIAFYSGLFGMEPTRQEADYAKWQLEDPKVNFAISLGHEGLSHLGIQVDEDAELKDLMGAARAVAGPGVEETDAACCYARSDKLWIDDPAGLSWELFRTHGSLTAEAQLSERPRAANGVPLVAEASSGGCAGCC